MQKVRILGRRDRASAVIQALQELGVLHVCPPPQISSLSPLALTPHQARHLAQVRAALEEVEEALARIGRAGAPVATPADEAPEPISRHVRRVRRARRALGILAVAERGLEERRHGLSRLVPAFEAFSEMEVPGSTSPVRILYLVLDLHPGAKHLEETLRKADVADFELNARPIGPAGIAVALIVPEAEVERIEALFAEAGVRELDLPEGCVGASPGAALDELRRDLEAVERDRDQLLAQRDRLASWLLPGLQRARATFCDWLSALEALQSAAVSEHLFVLDGWLPAAEHRSLECNLLAVEDDALVIEDLARETWSAREVPVAIRNPRLFRPFEVITRRLPLPRYGTMDPTPFVAVFFPMFFGLILGDLGYGSILAVLAVVGWTRSAEGSGLRSLCQIAAGCAVFSLIFGLLFGELFGDLGRRVLGMRPLVFSREEALLPFLALALALGFVHVLLGLVLGALSSLRSDPRESLGRGLAAVMLLLTAAVLLAAFKVLPAAFFTPAAIVLLLSFPALIAIEGAVGPIEFLSRLSNVLSYARIMALGTASVMLAVAANRLAGTLGGVAVGVLFATLFHLVNFGLGVFSPTVHALRLHFVEFFGTFYSPGGLVYRPLRRAGHGTGMEPAGA